MNDGTSLKPEIEFDSRLKENVGLKFKVDLAYVKEHKDPSADDLRENMITEAIVSSLTTLDNKFSLPCAVDYATQKGKTGEVIAKNSKLTSRQFSCVRHAKDAHQANEVF